MATRALSVFAGREAAATLARDGWSADHFDLLLGASGGPKWFVLSQLDRVLFGDYLARRSEPLSVLGSSIGSWRHACLATGDPAAAIARMEAGYLYQEYSSAKPGAEEISEVSLRILGAALGENGARELVSNERIRTHIVTARGRGAASATSPGLLATGMGAAALGNALSRELLRLSFQRVVFHNGSSPQPRMNLADFDCTYAPLNEDSVTAALHASGAIPFVLMGERDIPGAPPGQYWDGGIIDYHFDLGQYRGDGLMLYPHFSAKLVPGWFDKFLPWRAAALHQESRMVMLCPSDEFIADLPHGKIPDRNDFARLGEQERIRYWETCIERCKALGEEFLALVDGADPLSGVTVFDS